VNRAPVLAAVGPVEVPNATAMEGLARTLVAAGLGGGSVYLEGELGAGKTTFARGLLAALGVRERIKSPTYTLVERYAARERILYHFDLFRISEPAELEYIGLREAVDSGALCLVEWPGRGGGALPAPGLRVRFEYRGERRAVWLTAYDGVAAKLLDSLDLPRVARGEAS